MSSKIKYMKLTMLVLATLAMAPSVRAANSGTTIQAYRNAAIQLFNANRLDDAGAAFAQIVKAQPRDGLSQYYLAVILARQGRIPEARAHFAIAYSCAPTVQIANNCRLCVNRIDELATKKLRTQPDSGEDSTAAPEPLTARDIVSRPLDANASRVAETVAQQANERSDIEKRFYRIFEPDPNHPETGYLAWFSTRAIEDVEQMKAALDEMNMPFFSANQIAQMEEFYLQKRAQLSSSSDKERESENQAKAVQDSAQYVARAMGDGQKRASGVHLLPIGTNLYVRRYDSAQAPHAPRAELLADQDMLVLHEHDKKNSELVADQDQMALWKNIQKEKLKVTGRLMQPATR